jgi:hypothetical protein
MRALHTTAMKNGFTRRRAFIGLFVVLVGIPSACSGRSDVDVLDVSVQDGGMTLDVGIGTCNESSTEVSVIESEDTIVLAADTQSGYGCGGADDCNDIRVVDLADPVGERRIVDSNGNDVRRAGS